MYAYSGDGLGSTTELANGGGIVSDTYRYDAFGAVRSSSGASTQPFRYTGEQWDTTRPGGYHPGGASGVHIMANRASPRSRLTGLNTSHSRGSTWTSMRG